MSSHQPLGLAAFLTLGWLVSLSMAVIAQEPRAKLGVGPDTLTRVEDELKRLSEQARHEGPRIDPPSEEMAYFLLVGLTNRGDEIKPLTDADRREMPIGKAFEGRVFALAKDKRIALGEDWACFRDDGALYVYAEYYSRTGGKWRRLGCWKFFPQTRAR